MSPRSWTASSVAAAGWLCQCRAWGARLTPGATSCWDLTVGLEKGWVYGWWMVFFSHFSHGEALKNLKLDSSSGESLTVQCRYMRKFCGGDVKPFLIVFLCSANPSRLLYSWIQDALEYINIHSIPRNSGTSWPVATGPQGWAATGVSYNILKWDPQVTVGFNRKECSKNLDDFGYPKILGHLHRSDSRIENIVIMW